MKFILLNTEVTEWTSLFVSSMFYSLLPYLKFCHILPPNLWPTFILRTRCWALIQPSVTNNTIKQFAPQFENRLSWCKDIPWSPHIGSRSGHGEFCTSWGRPAQGLGENGGTVGGTVPRGGGITYGTTCQISTPLLARPGLHRCVGFAADQECLWQQVEVATYAAGTAPAVLTIFPSNYATALSFWFAAITKMIQ